MNDEARAPDQQQLPEEKIDYSEPDWYLQYLVEIINGTDSRIPITLYVQGTVVCGLLVSGHVYFDGIADDLRHIFRGDSEEETDKMVKNMTWPREQYLQENEKENENPRPAYYVHLAHAKVFVPGHAPMPENEGVWWRGRVSEVSAFHLGALAATRAEQ